MNMRSSESNESTVSTLESNDEQMSITQEDLSEYSDIINAGSIMIEALKKSPEYSKTIASLEEYLKDENSNIDADTLVLELLESPEFSQVLESANSSSEKTELRGIGLGLFYHYGFLKKGGKEKGIEGIYIFSQTVGDDTEEAQFATRQWDYDTSEIKVDLGVVAGINISLWFATPVSSTKLYGMMGELAFFKGLSLHAIGILPYDNKALTQTVDSFNWPKVLNNLSIGGDIGIALGAAKVTGSQTVSIKSSLPTISIINTSTDTNYIYATESTELKLTYYYPYADNIPVTILNNNSDKTTTLTVSMPSFILDSLSGATVSVPNDWELSDVSDGAFLFTYTGADNQELDTNLEFTFSGIVSNSGISSSENGFVIAKMENKSTTRNFNIPSDAKDVLHLRMSEYTIDIDWNVTVDTANGYTVTGATSGTLTTTETSGGFIALTSNDETTIITDQNGIQWYVGYKLKVDDSNEPSMLAAWQAVGSPQISNVYYFPTGWYPLSNDPTTLSINYKNVTSSTNLLEINANIASE